MERTCDHVGDRIFLGGVERDTHRETERVRKALFPGIVLPRAQEDLILSKTTNQHLRFHSLARGQTSNEFRLLLHRLHRSTSSCTFGVVVCVCLLSPGLQDNLAVEVGLIPKSVGGGVYPWEGQCCHPLGRGKLWLSKQAEAPQTLMLNHV